MIFRLFTMFRAHIIIGNIKSSITGIYHGMTKREMPLFLNEQENRFNHRNMGKTVMDKIKKYLQRSFPISHRDSIYPEYFCSTFLLNRHLLIMGIQMVVYYLEKLYWQRDQPHNVSGVPFHC